MTAQTRDSVGIALLPFVVAGGILMAGPAEKYWWLAASVSSIGVLLVLWFQYGQHKVRSYRMKYGFTAFLTIAPESDGSMCHELHVPPHTEVLIQLRLFPRFHYKQTELIFGFTGNKDERPQPLKVVNTFVKQGKRREQSPDDNDEHYIDLNDNYHIHRASERTKPNCYATGFLVKTRKPGRYPVRLEAITDCGESLPLRPLTVIVEDRVSGGADEAKQLTRS